jgi:hypothetical protein
MRDHHQTRTGTSISRRDMLLNGTAAAATAIFAVAGISANHSSVYGGAAVIDGPIGLDRLR